VKGALDDSDAYTFLALRFSVAAAVAGAIAGRQLIDPRLVRPGAWLGLFLFLGFATQTWGLHTTSPSRSAFITSLFVVFVPLFRWVMFTRSPSASAFAGAALAILGTYVLTGASLGGGLSRGDWLTVACAAAYSVHIVLTEAWSKELPSVPLVTAQVIVVAALAWLTVPLGPQRLVASTDFAVAVLLTGIVATALGISIQTWAQSRTTAVRAALIIALEPVFATAWSVFTGREPYEPRVLQGGALVLLGVGVAEVFRPRAPDER
jgi:drug/metabolite transporter (DMT)-like permease